MYTMTSWRITFFTHFYSFFFPLKNQRMYRLRKMMMIVMIKKNAVILLDSYFQVIYKLSKLFLMIIPWVWYPFSDKRMKVLGSWVLSPRSYKKKSCKECIWTLGVYTILITSCWCCRILPYNRQYTFGYA